ncbi:hypothetical protein L0657_21765 [Dyadobacter sp. CY345]|uniref:hypothetical protein n=1 Tax=Dyadobacter sp. CY345 TaxID=2909335 RepID=UPI001F238086|nr:hypothetical protein [Dyadobacter sp. CY345]MCF2446600.1 hypothetical protein [Dyadobacter sp. CY345]
MTEIIASPAQIFKANMLPTGYNVALVSFVERYKSSDNRMTALEEFLREYPALINGKFYERQVSENGVDFYYPNESGDQYFNVLAWSRILDNMEYLCAINLNQISTATIHVTIDDKIHPIGSKLYCLHGTNECPNELNVEVRNGKSIRLTIPAGEIVCYGAKSE